MYICTLYIREGKNFLYLPPNDTHAKNQNVIRKLSYISYVKDDISQDRGNLS